MDIDVKKIKKGMIVKTDFYIENKQEYYKVKHIEANDGCGSGYMVSLESDRCEHCGYKPSDLDDIDAAWISEIVEE